MSRRNPEYHSCTTLTTWWGFACRMFHVPELLLFHIPNQSASGPVRGMHLKRMGVRSGTPDYFLAVPRHGKHGVFIEMKAPEGKISAEQKLAAEELRKQGYEVVFCYSTDAARAVIEAYLK